MVISDRLLAIGPKFKDLKISANFVGHFIVPAVISLKECSTLNKTDFFDSSDGTSDTCIGKSSSRNSTSTPSETLPYSCINNTA